MKTIMGIIAAAALVAAANSAQANYAEDFFKKQSLYGENIDADAVRTGQILHPYGFFGADKK